MAQWAGALGLEQGPVELSRVGSALSSSRTSRHREGSDPAKASAPRRFSQHHTEGLWDRLFTENIRLINYKGLAVTVMTGLSIVEAAALAWWFVSLI